MQFYGNYLLLCPYNNYKYFQLILDHEIIRRLEINYFQKIYTIAL